ncbi:unnamed protein product [Closterium sp. Yama58-4]|nr:unnamed protein product [Closterium sp. Yama58-4]
MVVKARDSRDRLQESAECGGRVLVILLHSRRGAMEGAEERLLRALNDLGEIKDSGEWAASAGVDHGALVGTIKSLLAYEMIVAEEIEHQSWTLTDEAKGYLDTGSPEAQVFNAVPDGGIPLDALKKSLGAVADIGMKQAMANKWLAISKGEGGPTVQRKVASIEDKVQRLLTSLSKGETLPAADTDYLHKKRKLISPSVWRTYSLGKGAKFALEKKKAATDLTRDMIQSTYVLGKGGKFALEKKAAATDLTREMIQRCVKWCCAVQSGDGTLQSGAERYREHHRAVQSGVSLLS